MTFLSIAILVVLSYGSVRFMYGLVKELGEFFIEAWRDVKI